jgi:hypothetical protein
MTVLDLLAQPLVVSSKLVDNLGQVVRAQLVEDLLQDAKFLRA